MTAPDPLEQLRRGAMAYLDVAANADVRRICLLDAPSVLPTEVRRELAERYGLGLVRECSRPPAWRRARSPVSPSNPSPAMLLAALLEAATLVAEGADRAEVDAVVERTLAGLGMNDAVRALRRRRG